MRKMTFALGMGIGYVLGTRSGRSRYEQMVTKARAVAERPEVRTAAGKVTEAVQKNVATAQSKVGDKLPSMLTGHNSDNGTYPTSMQDEMGATRSPHPTA
jgi:hypothetical protein